VRLEKGMPMIEPQPRERIKYRQALIKPRHDQIKLDKVVDDTVRETEYFRLHGANLLYNDRYAD
jgi:hypothetical protein